MKRQIKGIPIVLYDRIEMGTDPFGVPQYEEVAETVENVLIGHPESQDIINEMQLSGKRIQYTLGIPKGDAHQWEDRVVEFFGRKFKTFGFVTQGIDELMPLEWNKKIMVEAYDGREDRTE